MATYGKKKRSLLPSLSSLREAGFKVKDKSRLKQPLVQILVPPEPQGEEHGDSIGEMVNKLLGDSTDELQPTPGKYLSQVPKPKTLSNLAQNTQFDFDKPLPQHPELVFNGDNAWRMKNAPVVTADGHANTMHFDGDGASSTRVPPSEGSRESSPPPIPPKSLKRKSVQPKTNNAKVRGGKQIVHHTPEDSAPIPSSTLYANEDAIKEAIERANRSMEGKKTNANPRSIRGARKAMSSVTDQALLQGPYVTTKKRGFMESKALAKVKTAIDRFQFSTSRRRRDSARDDRLLNDSNNELQEWEEGTPVETRFDEGKPLMAPQVHKFSKSGGIKRKPVADGGKSLKHANIKQTGEDAFLDGPRSSSSARTSISFENQMKDDMDLDEDTEFVPESMLPMSTPKRSRSQLVEPASYIEYFDAMLSSSPQGQSTPRVRLEPSFKQNGEKTLTKIRSDSRPGFESHSNFPYSVLPSEMDIDVEQIGVAVSIEVDTPKRKGSQDIRSPVKRSKKHPSPKREELEQLALAMEKFSDEEEAIVDIPVASRPLSSKDANGKLKTGKCQMRGEVAFAKQELPRTAGSMPDLSTKGLKSAMRKSMTETGANRPNSLHFRQNSLADGSLDMDELQWNITEYNIGGKKL